MLPDADKPSFKSFLADVQVRSAQEPDIQAISDIYNHYVTRSTCTFALTEEPLSERIAWFEQHQADGLPIYVALIRGEIVGWASLSHYHVRPGYRTSLEPSVYIHHERHGLGIGKVLTEQLIESARKRECHCLVALICSENEQSLQLFARYGFETVGVLKEVGRKFDRWLGVTLMQRMMK